MINGLGKQAKEHLTFDDESQLPFLSYITYPVSRIYHTAPPLSLPHSCTPLELVPILYFAYDITSPLAPPFYFHLHTPTSRCRINYLFTYTYPTEGVSTASVRLSHHSYIISSRSVRHLVSPSPLREGDRPVKID